MQERGQFPAETEEAGGVGVASGSTIEDAESDSEQSDPSSDASRPEAAAESSDDELPAPDAGHLLTWKAIRDERYVRI
jgi:hypothetical protein